MIEHNIDIPPNLEASKTTAVVERVCANENLSLSLQTTLKKYPGCTHWHFKRQSESGVLEITWWPRTEETQTSRLWLSIHGNRRAEWIVELMPRLRSMIEHELQNNPRN